MKGKDWQGLREMLLGKMCSGGMKKWREGRGEGGGPLVPEARRVERDGTCAGVGWKSEKKEADDATAPE